MTSKLDLARVKVGLPLGLLMAGMVAWGPAAAASGIANTKHNLTPTGPGTFKAPEATGLCVFCHTPHNANPQRALWNRAMSAATYTLYSSTTLKAQPTQPTGSSRLCLSCHDGTLAMGTLLRPLRGVQPTLGILTGAALIGTDLSDDHPISFAYDSALAATRGELVDPLGAPKALHRDPDGQLQCSSCHDAHVERAKFLRMDPIKGALCTTCHQPSGWSNSRHASSVATWTGTGTNPWPSGGYTTVADNACMSCHRPHAAGHGKALLAQSGEVANCTVCHTGTVANAGFNFNNEFAKLSRHPIETAEWTHEPKENASTMPRHVTCTDCHNGHAADAGTASVPNVSGPLKGVRGIDQSGGPVAAASFEQEVCYKCHGLNSASGPALERQDNVRNARLQFDPANASFHPVAAVGRNTTIPSTSLLLGLTASSRIGCTSCHNNNEWTAGGTKPAGPHGSNYKPLLERNYNAESTVIESPNDFALCYKCHDRTSVLAPGKFPHAIHLSNATSPTNTTSCAACHDAHGSRTQSHLINFMLFDGTPARNPVVTQSGANPITYNPVAKSCTLMCHGKDHAPLSYP